MFFQESVKHRAARIAVNKYFLGEIFMKKIFMVCNAHLDPVWQWHWQEGVATVLSTFRSAANLCEQYDDFIFCHNEARLYKWVEEYEPELFFRIKALVAKGKWKIMGGWYLQPDCNLISGESFVRQIEEGRRYFWGKFGAYPTVAINFDPFGHSRGLVQILSLAGYRGYLICRPARAEMDIQGKDDFIWSGFDGTQIKVNRCSSYYSSAMGMSVGKVKAAVEDGQNYGGDEILLWGAGNHGGGASRKDIEAINSYKQGIKDIEIKHSYPEEYFESSNVRFETRVDKTLGKCFQGCYSSQSRIKRKYRELESKYYAVEAICSHAAFEGKMNYPADELYAALEDMMFLQFHDILPGTSIESAVYKSVQLADRALETLDMLHSKAFFALTESQPPAEEGEYPIMVYNPYPYEVEADITAEYMLANEDMPAAFARWGDKSCWQLPVLTLNGERLKSQLEKEGSNMPFEFSKRIVFRAKLKPMTINRVSCRHESGPKPELPEMPQSRSFSYGPFTVRFNGGGYLSGIEKNGREYLRDGVKIKIYRDCEDPWTCTASQKGELLGEMKLASPARAAEIMGLKTEEAPSLRIIEDGEVRTVVEGIYCYEDSWACIRYSISRQHGEVGMEIRLFNTLCSVMFKLEIPAAMENVRFRGRTAFGVDELECDGSEVVAQHWIRVTNGRDSVLLANDGCYGCSCFQGVFSQTLLRSSGYCANVGTLPEGRFSPRADMGEHIFNFTVLAGDEEIVVRNADIISALLNNPPYALNVFPAGRGKRTESFVKMDAGITLEALKPALNGGYILRLFNSTDSELRTDVNLPNCVGKVVLRPMQVKSLLYDNGRLAETGLIDLDVDNR